VCHLCGVPFQPGDKIQADHLVPAAYVTDISQLAPAHAHCNQSRGNRPLA
jgi:5-methylcytosine-specific restriction endonuclease McrA